MVKPQPLENSICPLDDTLNQGQISTNESNLEQTFQFGSATSFGDAKKLHIEQKNVNVSCLFSLVEEEKSCEQSFGQAKEKADNPRFSFLKNKSTLQSVSPNI